MKRLLLVLILVVVLTLSFATPAFAGPPEDAGKGTAWNEGLGNAANHLERVYYKTLSEGALWAWALIGSLLQPSVGPPPWFVH